MKLGMVPLTAMAVMCCMACGSSSNDDASTAVGPGAAGSGNAPGSAPVAGDSATIGSGNENSGGAGSGSNPDTGGLAALTVMTKETVDVWGEPRTFELVVPKTIATGKAYPVVFVFHGDGGNGEGMRTWLQLERESGDAAVVVYPDGKDASWDLYTPAASNADNAFLDAMLTSIQAKVTIDATRVFGTGYSSGAFFVNQVACRRSSFFRAIVSNSGGAPQEPEDPAGSVWAATTYTKCATQTAGVSALVIHGNDDYVVGTTSGTYDARYWAYVNGCDDSEETRTATLPSPCVQHSACPAGKRVVYCEIPGIGHGMWTESTKASWSFFASQ